jgi:hypothetical protein
MKLELARDSCVVEKNSILYVTVNVVSRSTEHVSHWHYYPTGWSSPSLF